MVSDNSSNNRVNSVRRKYVLEFDDMRNIGVYKLLDKISNQIHEFGKKYRSYQITKNEVVILVFSARKNYPKLMDFNKFKECKEYKVFTEMEDVKKFHNQKKIVAKRANIFVAKTDDNIYVYWIKYT